MKKMSFTRKMVFSLIGGLSLGIICLLLRQSLTSSGNGAIWTTINQLLFADITAEGNQQAIGLFFIGGRIFVNLLQLVIIPMVLTSITLAMIHIRDTKKLGRISMKTIRGFLITTVSALLLASVIGYFVMLSGAFRVENVTLEAAQTQAGANPLNIVLSIFPSNLVAAFSSNSGVLAVVFLAVVLGLIINRFESELELVHKLVKEINKIVTVFLDFIIQKGAPIAIFLLLSRTIASYGMDYLKPAAVYMLVTTATLLFFLLFGYALFIRVMTKLSPMPFIKKINKVAIFGFSTSSSAATLPLNMQVTQHELGVDEDVAAFTLPLGMTINMDGTAIMQVLAATFIASSAGYQLSFFNILTIACLALVASVGTPAAPGAGAVVLFTVLSGMGYTNPAALSAYALILAINRPIEMLVTSLNVVGDSAAAVYVSHSEKLLNETKYYAAGEVLAND